MTGDTYIESVLYLLNGRSDFASVEARNLITRLRAELAAWKAEAEAWRKCHSDSNLTQPEFADALKAVDTARANTDRIAKEKA